MWGSGRDADGSWHTLVEHESHHGDNLANLWLIKQGIRLHFSGYRHPQTQGKVERFHGAMAAALNKRGYPSQEQRQEWLNEFRQEYNHARPHEALGMQTPATIWHPSERRYDAN